MKTDFQYIDNQHKTVYYNGQGQMLYGHQSINGHNYFFDRVTGAMTTGFLADQSNHQIYYYQSNGQGVTGTQTINDQTYSFDNSSALEANGQVKINNDWYLFNQNHFVTGFQHINDQNKTVYYTNDGKMVHGQAQINGHWYLFNDITGAMKTGFQYIGDQHKTVYYNDQGQMLYGQQKINNDWYLFDNVTGAMKTGLQYIDDQHKWVVYANDGKMFHSNTTIGRETFYINNVNGAVEGVFNNADVICQRPELPTGCEITAVTMMLKYAGCNVNKIDLANEMPRSNDGNKGFVGNPFSPSGWWIFPTGIAPVVNHHIGHSQIMTGASLDAIKNKLIQGHLVVIWVANVDGFINHALTLTGFNGDTLYYNDPWTGQKASMSTGYFYQHWNADAQRAISY